VATCRRVLADLVALPDPPPTDGLRLGVAWLERTSPGIRDGIRALAPDAPPVELPAPGDLPVLDVLWYEAALTHATGPIEQYGADLQRKLRGAPPRERYLAARRELAAARRRLHAVWDEVDVLLAPTLPAVAPRVDATELGGVPLNEALGSLTRPLNGLGWPVACLPTAPAEDGLPGSVQVIGPPGADALVLAVAELLESRR
jgi:aspartyl-tRNA(Asn)/glutamyl-tRNA(Gln) amidotransferase subunit A